MITQIIFDWFQQDGVQKVISMIYSIVRVIRFAVPIILIIMTSLDIAKKVIDPNEKEGQQKILIRLIAAIIIFFIPTIINIFFSITGIKVEGINNNYCEKNEVEVLKDFSHEI